MPREPTSGCEQFGLTCQNLSQCGTMQECGSACSISSTSWTLLQRLRPSLSCHSGWGGWAWPVQCGGEPPLIGASWADCLTMVRKRHPSVADTMVLGLERDPAPSLRAVRECQQTLIDAGFEAPTWDVLSVDSPQETEVGGEPSQPKRGWQQKATCPVDEGFASQFTAKLGEVDQALMRSQRGPLASAPYTALPTT